MGAAHRLPRRRPWSPTPPNLGTSSRMRLIVACGCCSVLILSALVAQGADGDFDARILPLLKTYCAECHSGSEPEAGLSFDMVRHVSHVDDHPDLWEGVAKKLRRREMPPADAKQLSADEIKLVDAWISERMKKLLETQKPNPGRVTMRRLNKVEYNNTIRDLVGIDFHPADDFPADDTGYGFDNIGDVLSLQPLLMERYLAAADQIIDKAIVETVTGKTIVEVAGKVMQRVEGEYGDVGDIAQSLAAVGILESSIGIDSDGTYDIVIKAHGEQAGSDPARMSVRVDGTEVRLVDVPATQNNPGEYTVPWDLKKGIHKIGLAFVNDYYNPTSADITQRDRNLVIWGLQIRESGETVWKHLPETHRRIVGRAPAPGNYSPLAREIIGRFAGQAFRRPIDKEDVKKIFRLYQQAEKDGATFEQAIKVALTAILVSPRFLFRMEIDRPDDGDDGIRRIKSFELASRLSYFLWSSMPDDELLNLAKEREIRYDGNLAKQVSRMLEDAKSSALVQSFAVQWLQLRKLGLMTPDLDRFPQFTPELRDAMRRETELFFEAVMREDRPITDLLDADFTFVNERLAKHYGIEGVQGDEFRRVNVSKETRGGILTQASILTLTSNPTRTSPVKRGKWVLDNLLGDPPPPPPPGVPELPDENQAELVGTLRERLEQHRESTSCSVCHNRIDPLGFGLENYDAIGKWRSRDHDGVIDPSGVLPDGSTFSGPGELKQVLVNRRDDFTRAFAEKLLTYALGRGLTRSDRLAVDGIVASTKQNDYKFKSLILAVVESNPFLNRSMEEVP